MVLTEGEEIVTSGTFSVDAAAQLEGKPSMMNGAGRVESASHDHGNMQMIQNVKHETFEVSGNCGMCKDRIENAANSLKGVSSASWDISTKKIHIEYNSSIITLDDVQKAIADAGHDNGKYKASDEVYDKLPECCLYRN